jgi:hypothetical protein
MFDSGSFIINESITITRDNNPNPKIKRTKINGNFISMENNKIPVENKKIEMVFFICFSLYNYNNYL